MKHRRTLPIMALVLVAVVSAMLVRYTYSKRFPVPNFEPYQPRASLTPVATSLHFEVTLGPKISRRTQVAVERDCTYHIYYWIEHPERWPAVIVLGARSYTAEGATSFYRDWTADLPTALSAQLYTAILNIVYGASQLEVEPLIREANEWLDRDTATSPFSLEERERGIELLILLERFNHGALGPSPCQDQPATPVSARAIDPDSYRTGEEFPPAAPTSTSTPARWWFHPSSTPGKNPRPPTQVASVTPIPPGIPTSTRTPTPFYTATRAFTVSPTGTGAASVTPRATVTLAPTFTNTPQPTATSAPQPTSTDVPVPPTAPPSSTSTPPPPTTPPSSTPPPVPTNTLEPTVPAASNTPAPPATQVPSQTPRPSRTPRPTRTPRPV